jgi:hypothetical protein
MIVLESVLGRSIFYDPFFPLGQCNLEVENVAVDFCLVNLRVVPLHTVRGFFAATIIEQFQQFFVAADIILLNVFLDGFVILNPEDNVPGLIIGPTVVGLVGQAGLVGGDGHCGSGCELN